MTGWRVVREYPEPDEIRDFLEMLEEDAAFHASLMADDRGNPSLATPEEAALPDPVEMQVWDDSQADGEKAA